MRLFLALFIACSLSSCAPLIIGAAAGAAGGGVSSAKAARSEKHSPGVYAATILSNVVYFPAKVIFAGGGAIASGVGYLVSGADRTVSNKIWTASVQGDYLITPRMIEGSERVGFVGP